MTPFDCPAAYAMAWHTLSRVVLPQASDIPGIMREALKPVATPVPQPVAPTPASPQGWAWCVRETTGWATSRVATRRRCREPA
jgi:hypothetical protein